MSGAVIGVFLIVILLVAAVGGFVYYKSTTAPKPCTVDTDCKDIENTKCISGNCSIPSTSPLPPSTLPPPAPLPIGSGSGTGLKAKGAPCTANTECQSGNCGVPTTLTAFFKSFFRLGADTTTTTAPQKVCLDPVSSAAVAAGLVEGDSVRCNPVLTGATQFHTYRFTDGKLRLYPTAEIASSWNPTWSTGIKTVNCTGIPVGDPMAAKPVSTPTTTTTPWKCWDGIATDAAGNITTTPTRIVSGKTQCAKAADGGCIWKLNYPECETVAASLTSTSPYAECDAVSMADPNHWCAKALAKATAASGGGTTTPDTTFQISNNSIKNESNSKCLGVKSRSILDNASLDVYDCGQGDHQIFTLKPNKTLTVKHTGKCIAGAFQVPCLAENNSMFAMQQWTFVPDTKQLKTMRLNTFSFQQEPVCLGMTSAGDAIAETCDSSKNTQRWSKG